MHNVSKVFRLHFTHTHARVMDLSLLAMDYIWFLLHCMIEFAKFCRSLITYERSHWSIVIMWLWREGLRQDPFDLGRRREVFGSNSIPAKPMKNFLNFLWEAWSDVILIILTVAAVVSLVLSFYHPSSPHSVDETGQLCTTSKHGPLIMMVVSYVCTFMERNTPIYAVSFYASQSWTSILQLVNKCRDKSGTTIASWNVMSGVSSCFSDSRTTEVMRPVLCGAPYRSTF